MKQENNIEKLFQGAFENFEVTPPVSVKIEIDKQLGTKKFKPRWIFWWSTIIILFLTGIVFAVVNGGFYHSSSVPGLTASEQHSTTSNGSSKTNKPDSDDPLTSERVSENNQESKENEKSTTVSESEAADSQKVKSAIGKKNTSSDQSNSLKVNPKKRTAFSGKKGSSAANNTGKTNGAASGKSRSFNAMNQKASTMKKGLPEKSGSASKHSLTGKAKKRTTFSSGKKGSNSGTEGLSAVEAAKSENPEEHPEAHEKQPEIVPLPKSGNDKVAEKKKESADSIANVAASVDSTNKAENDTPAVKPQNDNSKARNWMVEIYGGPRFDSKTSKTDFALKSANSYQIGLGFSRRLNLGPLNYVTLDGEYGGGQESYRQSSTTSSVYVAGYDSIPVLDTTMTDTIGWINQPNYDTLNQTIETNNSAQITRFAFGLRTQFNFDLGSGFGIAVSPGYYYSRSKYQFSDSSSTSSSSQILLNLSLYYDWNRFRFRVGLDSRYELMGKNQNAYFDRRKSMLFTPQFGIGFKF